MLAHDALHPNQHTIRAIISSVKAQVSKIVEHEAIRCTELDFHANMVVIGRLSFDFESTGKTYNVRPFSEENEVAEDVPIIDGAIAYDDPHTGKTYEIVS